jgi:hypothetical protein
VPSVDVVRVISARVDSVVEMFRQLHFIACSHDSRNTTTQSCDMLTINSCNKTVHKRRSAHSSALVCAVCGQCVGVCRCTQNTTETTQPTTPSLQLPLNSSRHSDPSPLHASHETSRLRTHAAMLISPPLSLADPRDGGFAISPPPSCVLPRSRKRTEQKI